MIRTPGEVYLATSKSGLNLITNFSGTHSMCANGPTMTPITGGSAANGLWPWCKSFTLLDFTQSSEKLKVFHSYVF